MFNNLPPYKKYIFILIGFVGMYIYLFISGLPEPENNFTICIFKNITGYPCGACGTTRGMKYLVHGYFYKALIMNPLSYLAVGFTLISTLWIFRDFYYKQTSYLNFFKRKLHWSIIVLIIIFTVLNWTWNIYKGN